MKNINDMDLKKNLMSYVLILIILSLSFLIVVLLLLPQDSTNLTEIYFEDHEDLPSTVNIGEVYPFKVTIQNLEDEVKIYDVKVYLDISEQRMDLDSLSIQLGKGETYTFDEALIIPEMTGAAKVVVNVNDDEIYFWVNIV